MYNRVLVPIDLLELGFCDRALGRARELCEPDGGEIRLIYIRPSLMEAASRYLPPNFLEEEEKWATSELDQLAKAAGIAAADFSVVSPSGTIYDRILKEAASFGADLIVIGSHRPSLGTYLLGSNAVRVVRHATCSVLVSR